MKTFICFSNKNISHFTLENIEQDELCDPAQSVVDIINAIMFDNQQHEEVDP